MDLECINQLEQLEEIILESNRLPFTGSLLVNEQEAIDTITSIRENIPSEIIKASKIIEKETEHIENARNQAKVLLDQAYNEKQQLLDSHQIKKDAEELAILLHEKATNQTKDMLSKAKIEFAHIEQQHINRITDLEDEFAKKKQQLQQEALEYHQKLQGESAIMQEECDSLLINVRRDAAHKRNNATKYVDHILTELERDLSAMLTDIKSKRSTLEHIKTRDQSKVKSKVSNERVISQ